MRGAQLVNKVWGKHCNGLDTSPPMGPNTVAADRGLWRAPKSCRRQ